MRASMCLFYLATCEVVHILNLISGGLYRVLMIIVHWHSVFYFVASSNDQPLLVEQVEAWLKGLRGTASHELTGEKHSIVLE